MMYMLDTNMCIYLIKRRPPAVLERFQAHVPGEILVSSITVAELHYGVEKSRHQEQNRNALELFLGPLQVADFDAEGAQHAGNIRATLERLGTPIGSYDLLIAGHARSLDMILVTNNTGEFDRVPGLRVENWAVG
jgi:tRNA(fMet)-specific endonuclease VapC